MQFAVCCVPVSATRKEPFHTAEMVTQQLFGERCIVLENSPGWAKIRCKYDAYEGWCQASHLAGISAEQWSLKGGKLVSGLLNKIEYNGEKNVGAIWQFPGHF